MTKVFTKGEWVKIRQQLARHRTAYGLPKRVYGSVVLGSFNIRKLGRVGGRNAATWEFLADVCRRFDLLAVQEVMGDLSGLRELLRRMGPEYDLIVSDKTGAFPGDKGLAERLAFISNRNLVTRREVATDITYDRSKILHTLSQHHDGINAAVQEYGDYLNATGKYAVMAAYWAQLDVYEDALQVYEEKVHQATVAGTRKPPKSAKPKKPSTKGLPKRPKLKMPEFLSFIRSPYCVSFEVNGHPGTQPLQFMAINAHLYFGNSMQDRWQEFDALMDWIIGRVKTNDDAYFPNYILLGDLNLDFNNPKTDRRRMADRLKSFNDASGSAAMVNFPFLDRHKGRRSVFRTNARLTETFDQFGFFCRDPRFPAHAQNSEMDPALSPVGPDYGVFDFADLFSEALVGKPVNELSAAEKKSFFPRFEHKVSDHMPLWVRLPLP